MPRPITYAFSLGADGLALAPGTPNQAGTWDAKPSWHLGRQTKLVRFEGQTHDLSRNGHPRSRVIRLHEIADWFNQYL